MAASRRYRPGERRTTTTKHGTYFLVGRSSDAELFRGSEEAEQLLPYLDRHLVADVHTAKGAPESRTRASGSIELFEQRGAFGPRHPLAMNSQEVLQGSGSDQASIVIGRGALRQRDEQSYR